LAESLRGTRDRIIRRELLDHVIVLNEGHLRRRLHSYLRYSHRSRTHLALEKDVLRAPATVAASRAIRHAVIFKSVAGATCWSYLNRLDRVLANAVNHLGQHLRNFERDPGFEPATRSEQVISRVANS